MFDHPLSSRFDEQDAFLIFDDVEVPRDRMFIDGNVKVYNQVMTRSWHPNVMQQTMVRAQTKLEFAWGLATAMAEAINDNSPAAQQMLGELWCYADARAVCGARGRGPSERMGQRRVVSRWAAADGAASDDADLDAARQRDHQAAGFAQSAGDADLADDAGSGLRPFIDKYLRGAKDMDAERRIRLFRLAWDYAGTALASRVELYERFYLTSGARNQQRAHQLAKRDSAMAMVERFLTEPVE